MYNHDEYYQCRVHLLFQSKATAATTMLLYIYQSLQGFY